MKIAPIMLALVFPAMLFAEQHDANYFASSAPPSVKQDDSGLQLLSGNMPAPRPEDIVSFKSDSYACDTKENYKILYDHFRNQEITLAQAMFNNYTCVLIPTDLLYRVLSMQYGVFSGGQFIQITHIKNTAVSKGYWADPTNVKYIKYAPR